MLSRIGSMIITFLMITDYFFFFLCRLWGLFELYIFFVSIFTGVLTALARLIKMLLVSLLGILRMDQPLIPDWFLAINNTDECFKKYLATVLMYHQFNHPIALTFARILGNSFF